VIQIGVTKMLVVVKQCQNHKKTMVRSIMGQIIELLDLCYFFFADVGYWLSWVGLTLPQHYQHVQPRR